MALKIFVALCVLLALTSALPNGPVGAGGPGGWGGWGGWGVGGGPGGWGGFGGWGGAGGAGNPWLPPWVASAPWIPKWAPCTTIGSSCLDCTTKLVCTKVGGLQRACTDPTLPYCNLGECSATPSTECAEAITPLGAEPVAPAAASA